MKIQIDGLLKHQLAFLKDTSTRYLGLVGGFGSGKTAGNKFKMLQLAELNVGNTGLICQPTFNMLQDTYIPDLLETLEDKKIPFTFKGNPSPFVKIHFEQGDTKVLLRSAENYRRLLSLNLSFFGVDEIDTAFNRNKDKTWAMWRVLQSRLRGKGPYPQGFFTTTPEGYGFAYEFLVKQVQEAIAAGKPLPRRMIQASTYDNPHLPPDFIDDLLRDYPPNLIKAYLYGQFVNLTSGCVYNSFSRKMWNDPLEPGNGCEFTAFQDEFKNEMLHIGMDFNINKMSAITHIVDPRTNAPYAVDEFVKIRDTDAMIAKIKEKYPNRVIMIYPDASGGANKTNAPVTDINKLKSVGFNVTTTSKNQPVRDRINSMNAMFCNGQNERRYLVNVKRCPTYTEALEQQVYLPTGEPDKKHDQDHPNDASGYFIGRKYPIRSSSGGLIQLRGL